MVTVWAIHHIAAPGDRGKMSAVPLHIHHGVMTRNKLHHKWQFVSLTTDPDVSEIHLASCDSVGLLFLPSFYLPYSLILLCIIGVDNLTIH